MKCLKGNSEDNSFSKQDGNAQSKDKKGRSKAEEPLMLENLSETEKAEKKGKKKEKTPIDPAVRRGFIRKVYCILSAQLIVTTAIVAFTQFHKPTRDWLQGPGSWCYYASFAVFFVTNIALMCCCCSSIRRKFPANLICLALFTLSFSYLLATIASFYETPIVIITLSMTTLVCVFIILFNVQSKIAFTMRPGLLFVFLMVALFTGAACLVAWLLLELKYVLQCVFGGIAALLFSLFLVFRTQRLASDLKIQKEEGDYIYATLKLYVGVAKGNPWTCAKEFIFGRTS